MGESWFYKATELTYYLFVPVFTAVAWVYENEAVVGIASGNMLDFPPNSFRIINTDNYGHRFLCQLKYLFTPVVVVENAARNTISRPLITASTECNNRTIGRSLLKKQVIQIAQMLQPFADARAPT